MEHAYGLENGYGLETKRFMKRIIILTKCRNGRLSRTTDRWSGKKKRKNCSSKVELFAESFLGGLYPIRFALDFFNSPRNGRFYSVLVFNKLGSADTIEGYIDQPGRVVSPMSTGFLPGVRAEEWRFARFYQAYGRKNGGSLELFECSNRGSFEATEKGLTRPRRFLQAYGLFTRRTGGTMESILHRFPQAYVRYSGGHTVRSASFPPSVRATYCSLCVVSPKRRAFHQS